MIDEVRDRDHPKLAEVEGLRAVAVVLVVLYHLGLDVVSGGYIGVDVFFVVSGFLITGLLLREVDREGRVSLAAFWARRVRRIVPLSTLVAVSTVVVGLSILEPTEDRRLIQVGLGAIGFCANLVLHSISGEYLAGVVNPSPLQHYWSLGVEEQFYVAWPVMVALIVRVGRRFRRPALLVCALVAFAASLWASIHHARPGASSGFFLPHTRAWEIMAGSILAFVMVGLVRIPAAVRAVVGWGGLVAMAMAATTFDAETNFPGTVALLPVLGTVAVLVAGDASWGPVFVLRRGVFQYIGSVSFALYLWHWPAIVFFEHLHGTPDWWGRLVIIVISLTLAEASRRVVENPLRWNSWLSLRPMRSITVGLVVVALLLGAGALALVATPSRSASVASFAPLATPVATSTATTNTVASNISSPASSDVSVATSTTTPPTPEPRRVRAFLLGDSTMAVMRWFEQGQVALRGFEYVMDAEGCRRLYYQSCESRELRVPDEVVDVIPTIDVAQYDVLVVMAGYHSRPGSFEKELVAVGEALAATGLPVIFVNYKESMTFPEAGSKGTRSVYTGFNETLSRLVAEGRMGDTRIADWNRFTNAHPDWFRPDGIHTTIVGAVALGWFLSMSIADMFDNPCPFDGEYPCVVPDMDDGSIDYLARFGVVYTDTHCYEDRAERRRRCREDRRITATDL
jgi:peptidoglycan/LPS O-acetylase OafA/YrhL